MAGLAPEDVMAIIEGSQGGAQERLFVEFDSKEVEDPAATEECGYPQFKEKLYVKIASPGDSGNVIHRPATNCGGKGRCMFLRGAPGEMPCDAHRFPRQLLAFQGDLDQQEASGLPLKSWPVLNKAEVAMLKAQRIHTVEQLAAVNDSALPSLGPIRAIRQKAIDYVEAAKGLQPLQKMRAELEQRDNQIQTQQHQLEAMGKKLDELIAAQAGGPPIITEPTPKRARG